MYNKIGLNECPYILIKVNTYVCNSVPFQQRIATKHIFLFKSMLKTYFDLIIDLIDIDMFLWLLEAKMWNWNENFHFPKMSLCEFKLWLLICNKYKNPHAHIHTQIHTYLNSFEDVEQTGQARHNFTICNLRGWSV